MVLLLVDGGRVELYVESMSVRMLVRVGWRGGRARELKRTGTLKWQEGKLLTTR